MQEYATVGGRQIQLRAYLFDGQAHQLAQQEYAPPGFREPAQARLQRFEEPLVGQRVLGALPCLRHADKAAVLPKHRLDAVGPSASRSASIDTSGGVRRQ